MSYGSRKRGYEQEGCVWEGVDHRLRRHKHFVVVLCEQRTTDAVVSARLDDVHRGFIFHTSLLVGFTTLQTCMCMQRYSFRIAVFAYPTCIRRPRYGGFRRNIVIPFGVEKLAWLPDGKNFSKMSLFVLT